MKKCPDDINEWIIDETASSIVKEIFDMYLNQSLGMKVIARILNERKIVSPDSHRILLKGLEVDENKLFTAGPVQLLEGFSEDVNMLEIQ